MMLRDSGLQTLVAACTPKSPLVNLNLSYNDLTVEGIQNITTIMKNLQEIDLSGNPLGDTGVKSLEMGMIKILNLSDCDISDKGFH